MTLMLRFLPLLLATLALACQSRPPKRDLATPGDAPTSSAKALEARGTKPDNAYGPPGQVLNRFAYIPPQCYARTQAVSGKPARNPCFTCHIDSAAPNYVADGELQLLRKLPSGALKNAWLNLFDPPVRRMPAVTDEAVLRHVRASNYFVDGRVALADALRSLPAAWDGQGDGRWDGFVPDVEYRFDEDGFDLRADGTETGWRAFAYYPLPGAFMPTNGSAGDVLIRLPAAFRQDASGKPDRSVYVANLAIVEALVRATRGRAAALHYVGKARALEESGEQPIAPGLFPVGTEFFHTVRYLDVTDTGDVVPAARLKELRYAKKQRWYTPADLKAVVEGEAREQAKSEDGSRPVLWAFDRGIDNGQGWNLQGFIEDASGSLRPQTFEESAYCAGCHGGVGRTTDSIFSFSRRLSGDAPSHGWFHFSQRGLAGVPEPRLGDGSYEYSEYLRQARGGDDYGENEEVRRRFFGQAGELRPEALAKLHRDVTWLLLPSPERALGLDRAYLATVREQSFTRGRDTLPAALHEVMAQATPDERTGVTRALRWFRN